MIRSFTLFLFTLLYGLSFIYPSGPVSCRASLALNIVGAEPCGPSDPAHDAVRAYPVKIMKGLIVLPAESGRIRGYVILDTGCGTTVFNSRHLDGGVKTYALENDFFFIPGDAAARHPRRVVIERFSWDPIRCGNLSAVVLDLGAIEKKLGLRLIGVIGADILSTRVFLIDYPEQVIYLWKDAARAGRALRMQISDGLAEFQPVHEIVFTLEGDGKIVLPVTLNDRTRYFMVDTGSSHSLISRTALAGKASSRPRKQLSSDLMLTSLSGPLESEPVLFDDVIVGNYTERHFHCCIPDPENYFSTLTARMKNDIHGVLGHSFFRDKKVGFDFPGRRLLFRGCGRASF